MALKSNVTNSLDFSVTHTQSGVLTGPRKGSSSKKSRIWQQHKLHLFASLMLTVVRRWARFVSRDCGPRLASPPPWELLPPPPPSLHFMKPLKVILHHVYSPQQSPLLLTNLSCHYKNSAPLQLCTPTSGDRMAPLWTQGLGTAGVFKKCAFHAIGGGRWVIACRWLQRWLLDRTRFECDRRSFHRQV